MEKMTILLTLSFLTNCLGRRTVISIVLKPRNISRYHQDDIRLRLETVSIGFASSPLVSGLCDRDTLTRCADKVRSALGGFYWQQNSFAIMEIFCKQDILDAMVCVEQESANCLEDTSYSSYAPLLRMVNADTLQENCNILSNIPRDARTCLGNALSFSNTEFSQCILSASQNVLDSLKNSGIQGLDLCSISRNGQKCQNQAINEKCPAYRNALSDYNGLSNKFFPCSDSSSSAGKTSVTPVLIAACFAILKLLHG